jgi:hypothetical protein
MFKNLFVFLSIICIPLFFVTNFINAEEHDFRQLAENLYTDNSGNYYKDSALTEKIVKVYYFENGVLTPMDIEDYAREMKKIDEFAKSEIKTFYHGRNNHQLIAATDFSPLSPTFPTTYFTYDESRNFEREHPRGRQTPIIRNLSFVDTMTHTFEFSTTQGHSFSVSLSTPERSAFMAGLSFTWTSSATTRQATTISISPRHQGWIEFAAKMRRSEGNINERDFITHRIIRSRFVRADYPVRLPGGSLDGWITGVTRRL